MVAERKPRYLFRRARQRVYSKVVPEGFTGSEGVSPASERGVSPWKLSGRETLPELAGEDACATLAIRKPHVVKAGISRAAGY
jgi:hypothetical protein